MIYKHTGKLLANSSGKKSCCNGRINSAWQCKKNLAAADFFTNLSDRILNESIHLPVSGTSTYAKYKVGQHGLSFYRVKYLRMELNRIQFLVCVFCCSYRTVCCMCRNLKSRSRFGDIICMAHPDDSFFWNILENCRILLVNQKFCFAILADICFFNFSTKDMHHQLCAIAKSKYRDSKFKQFFLISRCIRFIAAVWTAGKDNSLRIHFFNLCNICLVRIDFAIYVAFSDASRNQLIVLTAKIDDNN